MKTPLLLALSLAAVCAGGGEPLTLITAPGGKIECPALAAKFLPTRRRADDSFREFVAEGAVDARRALTPTLAWTFPPRGAGEKNVVMLKLDAARWAGGACRSDAGTTVLPPTHEKGKRIHLTAGTARTFTFTDPNGAAFSLDFGGAVAVHAMDEREWNVGTFVFRFTCAADAVTPVFDAGGPVAVQTRPAYEIRRGPGWIPLEVKRDIAEGSALDFSQVVPTVAPCRRVIAKGRHFAFADSPDVPRRFYGVNICRDANFVPPETADAFVRLLRRRGYNALRLHHHDGGLVEGSADGTTINPAQMARMDALLAACGRHGVYVTTDLFVSRAVPRRAIGQDADGVLGMDEFKSLVLVHEGAFSNLCTFARAWMTHVNPHTGRRWADDPALACLAFVNEGHIGMGGAETLRRHPEFVAAWNAWRANEAGNAPAEIPRGKPWAKTPEMAAFARFIAALEGRFARRMRTFLKEELGVQALLSDMSAGMEREPFRAVRAQYDYVDEHFYWDHPSWPGEAWRTPVRSRNANPVKAHGDGILADCARVRLADKPFVSTECTFSGPSPYRLLGGLVIGAEAARDGWAGVWRFDWGGGAWAMQRPDQVRAGLFAMGGDALLLASDLVAVNLFLRGDLAEEADVDGKTPGKTGAHAAVTADRATGAFTVRTPRTAGGFAEDGRIMAGTVAALCDAGPVTVWATALDGRPLRTSRRILIAHLTDLCNSGDAYEDATRRILLRWGKPPHLVRAGRAHIALSLAGIPDDDQPRAGRSDDGQPRADATFQVFALDTSGRRVRTVPHDLRRGRLRFVADTAADPDRATFLYELLRTR